MAAINHELIANDKAAHLQTREVVEGDPKYDGRVIIYVVKGEKIEALYGPLHIAAK